MITKQNVNIHPREQEQKESDDNERLLVTIKCPAGDLGAKFTFVNGDEHSNTGLCIQKWKKVTGPNLEKVPGILQSNGKVTVGMSIVCNGKNVENYETSEIKRRIAKDTKKTITFGDRFEKYLDIQSLKGKSFTSHA